MKEGDAGKRRDCNARLDKVQVACKGRAAVLQAANSPL
jgi:hypothetical protein